jgi:hypothetical protein
MPTKHKDEGAINLDGQLHTTRAAICTVLQNIKPGIRKSRDIAMGTHEERLGNLLETYI